MAPGPYRSQTIHLGFSRSHELIAATRSTYVSWIFDVWNHFIVAIPQLPVELFIVRFTTSGMVCEVKWKWDGNHLDALFHPNQGFDDRFLPFFLLFFWQLEQVSSNSFHGPHRNLMNRTDQNHLWPRTSAFRSTFLYTSRGDDRILEQKRLTLVRTKAKAHSSSHLSIEQLGVPLQR